MSPVKWFGLAFFLCCDACFASSPVWLPFELVDGLVYVQTSINGSAPLPFVLDTGASYSVLAPETAQKLAIRTNGALSADGPGRGGKTTMDMADGVDIRVGGIELERQKVAVLPVDYITRQAGHPTAGILSVYAFGGYAVQVDYAAKQVRFFDAAAFAPSSAAKGIPISFEDNVPFVQATVTLAPGKTLSGRFVLDSGLVGTIVFSKPFLTRHSEFQSVENRFDLPAVEAVGGTMKLQAAYIPSFRMGDVSIEKPLAVFSVDGAGVLDNPRIDGIIGCEVLQRFLVTYDYARSRFFLAPGTAADVFTEK